MPIDAFDPTMSISCISNRTRYTCYKKCGSNKLITMSRIEKNVLNNMTFKCQHADSYNCKATIKYENYRRHLELDCVHKLVFPMTIYRYIQEADLPNLFREDEGDKEDAEWRFVLANPLAPVVAPPVHFDDDDDSDVDIGGLFGDDDDY